MKTAVYELKIREYERLPIEVLQEGKLVEKFSVPDFLEYAEKLLFEDEAGTRFFFRKENGDEVSIEPRSIWAFSSSEEYGLNVTAAEMAELDFAEFVSGEWTEDCRIFFGSDIWVETVSGEQCYVDVDYESLFLDLVRTGLIERIRG